MKYPATKESLTLAQLGEFETIIDARSPLEYANDHIPNAISLPVLNDEERKQVGTLYIQDSPFKARKLGAALVARNIANHLESHLSRFEKNWRPLVYCWRGGQRSGAFVTILREVGWDAQRLNGGYKSWRRLVLEQLTLLPELFAFKVISGATGTGKSRILDALKMQGAQILHLEELAGHRGSVLGNLFNRAQPSQRHFESLLYSALALLDKNRPVFIEAESNHIGAISLPPTLRIAIRNAPHYQINANLNTRIAFLLREYEHFTNASDLFANSIRFLSPWKSADVLDRWLHLAKIQDWAVLVRELLELHYDPLYRRSLAQHFPNAAVVQVHIDELSPNEVNLVAKRLRREVEPHSSD